MWENKARAAIAEAFLAALKEDEIPWRKCWSASPVSMSSGKPYKGINNLMLSWVTYQKGYQDTRWMTYKYAQDHGWQVQKGEKSVRVEYWQHYDAELKKALSRDEVIRIQQEEPERMEHIRLVAYTANVFNVEQVAGDIPPLQREGTVRDPAALKRCRDAFLANLGVAFGEGGDRAYYSPGLDKIQMPLAETFAGDYAYMCTLLHEAGHSTGHPSRLDRDMSGGFGSLEYAKEELRAEIASAFTAQALHLSYKADELDFEMENHKAYIQSWIAALKKDPNELFAAIKDANQIADYLLEHGKLLELTQAATPRGMSVEDLSRDQMAELKSKLFWGAEDQEKIHQILREDQIDILERAQDPEEIPDEIVQELYGDTYFVDDDFRCSCSNGSELEEEDQAEL